VQALVEACHADRSAAVRRAYAAAAALLCRYATAARATRFVSDALAGLGAENASKDDRYVAGESLVSVPCATVRLCRTAVKQGGWLVPQQCLVATSDRPAVAPSMLRLRVWQRTTHT
jgi:hypothetical protein